MPVLSPGDIVVLDNLGSHPPAILGVGVELAFLPPYSPDFNPIGQVFAKVKHWLRMAQALSIEANHDTSQGSSTPLIKAQASTTCAAPVMLLPNSERLQRVGRRESAGWLEFAAQLVRLLIPPSTLSAAASKHDHAS
jgi:DDE superfamily endonuclease